MGDVIGPVILGIIISILGISNMKGNISSLHWYHRQRVSPDDVMPFGKRVGLGTLIIGIAISYTYDTLGNLLKQSGPTKGEEDTYQYNDLNQMVSKHVCGYEQKLTRIYDYGYTYDKRGNLVKEEEICSPTTTGPRNITMDLKKLQTTTLR
jgi:hypothetical protein